MDKAESTMVLWTLVYGIFLSALGVGAYIFSGMASITALIPAFFGIPVIILAVLARKDTLRSVAMHIVVVLAVIGFAATVMGVLSAVQWLGGSQPTRPSAVVIQTVMNLTSLAYAIASIIYFIKRRSSKPDAA